MTALPYLTPLTADTLGGSLQRIHACIRRHCADVERVAVALYDPRRDTLKTFVHSTDGGSPLEHYEASLADIPSLGDLAHGAPDRVIDDLSVFQDSSHEHTRRLLERGYRSSYTLALRDDGGLWGLLFFDSRQRGYFGPVVTERLAAFGEMVGSILKQSLAPVRMLHSALRVVSRLTHYRDPETSGHLDRMSRYARLVAQGLAARDCLSDEFVEFLFLFAPVHDIGKIAIPESVLLKRERLTQEEFGIMRTHVTTGGAIVDGIVEDLGLHAFPHIGVLRNVVLFHHEAVDGTGYPYGLSGSAIPLEARIVAVADVFDALTSRRCYKDAWRSDEAFGYLDQRAGKQFDEACVSVLRARGTEIDAIRLLFPDEEDADYQSRDGYSLEL